MIITRTSPFTGKVTKWDIDVTTDQILLWQSGVYIQRAMPNLTEDEREFIKTGLTPEDWDSLFPNGDE